MENNNAKEGNLRVLINNIDDPIWLVDTNYTLLECNHVFRHWIYHFLGDTLTEGDDILFGGKNLLYSQKFESCYQRALNGQSFKSIEDMVVGTETRYTMVSFNPIINENNEVTGISCSARDITEQRQHLHKIEEQNTALREIAFIESHKIRGPLTTIMGLEQLFDYDKLAAPFNKEIMVNISRLSLELDEIIKEVVRKSNEIGLQQ